MTDKRRVVVTGLGMITPLGIGKERNWELLCEGKSGINEITQFDTKRCRTKIAGEVPDFKPLDFLDRKTARRTSRFIQFACAASQMALEDADLHIDPLNSDDIGVSIATALGGVEAFEKNYKLVLEDKSDRVSPFFIPSYISNLAPGEVAIKFGIRGNLLCSVTACAAGTHAIGEAYRAIQYGDARIMLAGGSEAQICESLFAGLDALKVMSTRNESPEKASRPFDGERDGFVCGEGSVIVIIEEMESALERGARIYAEIIGYGNTCDAYHITSPDSDGRGAAMCMQKAIKDAGLSIEDIDHINAHGTSTIINDKVETLAIKKLFGDRAYKIPVTSNKSMIGHMWGSAGAAEASFSVLSLKNGLIPPTINQEKRETELDLDYVPNTARKADIKTVLSNSFGFGGTNGCLLFKKYV
jgi:3-oxoacyl-[acyl-carrier-protein] synthase II